MITKCSNSECKVAQSCWRFMCQSQELQSWFKPNPDYNGDCPYYFKFEMKQNDISAIGKSRSRKAKAKG